METTLYPGTEVNTPRVPNIYSQTTMMKKEINLNLDDQNSELKSNPLRDTDGLLNSPDLGLLKLTSPDLERLIIQSNGLVTTATNNPTSQFLYPKSASDEQEFAEGFVKALEDLHKQNQLSEAGCVSVDRLELLASSNAVGSAGLQTSDLPVYTTLNGYAASPLGGTTINYSTDTIPFPPPPSHLASAQQQAAAAAALSRLHSAGVKDEPQTVPDMQSFGDSPPLSPIDMDNQERIKAERKKLRNRIAASKCRKRKLERISRLEDKVKTLKTQNTELASTASVLREQVAQLKQKVMNHVSSGCQLLPNQVQAY
ncbi:transcription factor jun-D-like [Seriola lalandi dorsalis]|uniref:Transcription factor JunD n=2 Tax=Seriola TaxID=8160 RepID=A0A3B4UHN3_SERDU|nr:transcription factor jun-D-like [Seriola dumerili]XP_023283923.1 transcription factor jun-D-like [Seriola lalandi dorsalis]XP_056246907.1 transcription factor JunD-like [Seriola aureovittata]